MEKSQAEAVAQAILEPHLRDQEALRDKRAMESASHARKRRVAWLTLAGAGVGAATTYFGGAGFSVGIIWGGLAGSVIGWLLARRTTA